jgi:tetratricopeptide (TPR) repeat protein
MKIILNKINIDTQRIMWHLHKCTGFCFDIYIILIFMILTGCASNSKQLSPVVNTDKKTGGDSGKNSDTIQVNNNKPDTLPRLSPASSLMVRACDNYTTINPQSPKTPEVLSIKASIFYNNKLYEQSRQVYTQIIDKFPNTPGSFEATRMMAQAFYEEKKFEKAQEWYRKLSDAAPEGVDKLEAIARIAESIFRMAEMEEGKENFKEAAAQYERVSLEFSDCKIADIALFNAGLDYEKLAEWSHAVLIFQRLVQKYPDSKLAPKAYFRSAKDYEKLMQWDQAAETYLRVTANFPKSELASTALYNAAFCFENGEKLSEAAATFEKMATLFPQSEDVADVLFRAGEIYGKIKDWKSVERVNELFSLRFGNDENRVIQALCMTGIALYMQNKEDLALDQLSKTVQTFVKIKNPSTINSYYAAKAIYTIGEIQQLRMGKISLGGPVNIYKKQLSKKAELLDLAVEMYSRVIKFNISEWTTRSIYQIGESYEEFAKGIFLQQRPSNLNLNDRIALELGIAQAVDKYLIEKALYYQEQNVKIGIKEKIEDKFILQSRQKLTYLPYIAGKNYLTLAEIAQSTQGKSPGEGFSTIANKLQVLQKIAPFQEKAIDLFLKCLELGSTYQETNEFYKQASENITRISNSVGETYSDVVNIARDAPIPSTFDPYETFVYKTKLLTQVEGYEEQALNNYMKTLNIAQAYKIDDQSVKDARGKIAALLFTKGRCYDLLCLTAFSNPPFPKDINEAEKEEYKARFEEIGLKFQEQAFEIYRNVLKFAQKNYASGEFVTHAYVRLYQNSPEEVGFNQDQLVQKDITSGSLWKCAIDSVSGWEKADFNDSLWTTVKNVNSSLKELAGFPGTLPAAIWSGGEIPGDSINNKLFDKVFFRRKFNIDTVPKDADFTVAAQGPLKVLLNGKLLGSDTVQDMKIRSFNLNGKLQAGKNILAICAINDKKKQYGIFPCLTISVFDKNFLPKPPGYEKPMTVDEVRIDKYKIPFIKNFSLPEPKVKGTDK